MKAEKLLKLDRWWASHYGTMVSFIYFVLATCPSAPPLTSVLQTFAIFTLASLGIGVFGHLLNDLADVSEDARAGARNLMAKRGAAERCLMLAAALAVGIIPWIWLPWTPLIIALVAAEFVLFVLYSLPPFRLKNRGILGAIADALYGYVIPNAFAILLFAQLGGIAIPSLAMSAILVWCFLFGLERIIHHQLLDADRDEMAGVRTFVVVHGWENAFRFVWQWIVPALAVATVVLLWVWGSVSLLVPLGFALHAGLTLRAWSHCGIHHTARLERLPTIDRYHLLAERLIATFVWRWLSLLALIVLVIAQPQYWLLVPLHLVLFPAGLLWAFHHGIPATIRLTGNARRPTDSSQHTEGETAQ